MLTRARRALLACALGTVFFTAEERLAAKCAWDSYDPIRLGAPIRGGYDGLAIVKVMPIYPPSAQERGARGRVISEALVDQGGNVVKTCSQGDPVLVKAVDDAIVKWKFVKNFGIVCGTPDQGRKFAVLPFTFEFTPESHVSLSK